MGWHCFIIGSILASVSCTSVGAVTVDELLSKRDIYDGEQITLVGYFAFDAVYLNREGYEGFSADYVAMPVKGYWKGDFYNRCVEREVVIKGIYYKGKTIGGTRNYIVDISDFAPKDAPNINCIEYLDREEQK